MTQGMIDTGTDHLLANLTNGVLTLTFNRPEARNALSGDLLQALGAQLSDAEINPNVRCVVVTAVTTTHRTLGLISASLSCAPSA